MLYEVELRRHRDTHRLLATTEHHLTQLGDGRRLRSECIQAPSLRKAVPRTSLDSTDTLAQELCAILGKGWTLSQLTLCTVKISLKEKGTVCHTEVKSQSLKTNAIEISEKGTTSQRGKKCYIKVSFVQRFTEW